MSEDSNSSKMNIDGNVTLLSGEKKEASIERSTSSQIYQNLSEEEKASVRKLSTKQIKMILHFRLDCEGLCAEKVVPVLTEELRSRGVP